MKFILQILIFHWKDFEDIYFHNQANSFGLLGDIIIAEPNAYIAFAGNKASVLVSRS